MSLVGPDQRDLTIAMKKENVSTPTQVFAVAGCSPTAGKKERATAAAAADKRGKSSPRGRVPTASHSKPTR